MLRRQFVSLVVRRVAVGVSGCSLTGCGSLLNRERIGQPHSNQIDWKIAALNGLGLLLFFVPGVIAFVVDFWTGAIYLPMEEHYPEYGAGSLEPPPFEPNSPTPAPPPLVPPGGLGLKRVLVPRDQLQQARIQQIVSDHLGREVRLDGGPVRILELARVEDFSTAIQSVRSTS